MNGRSRLDRYQNLRTGMSGDNTKSPDSNRILDSNYNTETTTNNDYMRFNSGRNTTSYQNSKNDYDAILKEHEEFLRSLDMDFTGSSFTTNTYNSNANQFNQNGYANPNQPYPNNNGSFDNYNNQNNGYNANPYYTNPYQQTNNQYYNNPYSQNNPYGNQAMNNAYNSGFNPNNQQPTNLNNQPQYSYNEAVNFTNNPAQPNQQNYSVVNQQANPQFREPYQSVPTVSEPVSEPVVEEVNQPSTTQTVQPTVSKPAFQMPKIKSEPVEKTQTEVRKPVMPSLKPKQAKPADIPSISIVYGPSYGDNFNPYKTISNVKVTQETVAEVKEVENLDDISFEVDSVASEPVSQLTPVSPTVSEEVEKAVDFDIADLETLTESDNSFMLPPDDDFSQPAEVEETMTTQNETVVESFIESVEDSISETEPESQSIIETEPESQPIIENEPQQQVEFTPFVQEESVETVQSQTETDSQLIFEEDQQPVDEPFTVVENEPETVAAFPEDSDVIIEENEEDVQSQISEIEKLVGEETSTIDYDNIFAYIDNALDAVKADYDKKIEKIEAVQDEKLDADQISDILSSWNLDNYQDEIRSQIEKTVESVEENYRPKNNVDAAVYYQNPIEVEELNEKLEKEKLLRQQVLEQTKQINLQVKEYENELDSVNDNMSRTNKILNFVLTLLIMTLFVILFVIGFWFAQERGLL
ncbi:MAG: hypothetical protein ACI4WG_01960 [Erysipelotrichaceae bacterium]